ncbi:hypothetical protein ACRRTK_016245 [Alexandromys fortis]
MVARGAICPLLGRPRLRPTPFLLLPAFDLAALQRWVLELCLSANADPAHCPQVPAHISFKLRLTGALRERAPTATRTGNPPIPWVPLPSTRLLLEAAPWAPGARGSRPPAWGQRLGGARGAFKRRSGTDQADAGISRTRHPQRSGSSLSTVPQRWMEMVIQVAVAGPARSRQTGEIGRTSAPDGAQTFVTAKPRRQFREQFSAWCLGVEGGGRLGLQNVIGGLWHPRFQTSSGLRAGSRKL